MTSFADILASAEKTYLSGSELVIVVIALGVIVAAAVVALVPIGIALHRYHPQANGIVAVALLWGVLAAGSVIRTVDAQLTWSKEWLTLVNTGYYDPHDASGAPIWPWLLWIVLAAAYGVLMVYALVAKPAPPADA